MDQNLIQTARSIVSDYTRGSYVFEESCTDSIGKMLSEFGENRKISFIMGDNNEEWSKKLHEKIKLSIVTNGLSMYKGTIRGAGPDAISEDIFRIATTLDEWSPDIIVAVGGGSAIDIAKIASLYWKLKSKFQRLETYEGKGRISAMFAELGKHIPPMLAFQTSISSSHINSFANVYSMQEKRLLFLDDPALKPARAIFDSRWTMSLPPERVKDGAIEAFSHCLEIYTSYQGEYEEYLEYACLTAIELILRFTQTASDENAVEARSYVALASDIAGIALMTAKANCGHLNAACQYSRHVVLCATLNPYYIVFYSRTIGPKLAKLAEILNNCGFKLAPGTADAPRDLSESVADGIMQFYRKIKLPTKLSDIPGFDKNEISNLIEAATKELSKNGFKQIPVELNLINASKYLRLLYEAALTGDYSIISSPK